MVLEEGKKAAQVVRELDLAEQTLYNLIKKYREESESVFVGSGTWRSGNARPTKASKRSWGRKCNLKKGYGHLREKPEVIYDFIEKHRHEFRVAKMCGVLGVSKSGYYAWKNDLRVSKKYGERNWLQR